MFCHPRVAETVHSQQVTTVWPIIRPGFWLRQQAGFFSVRPWQFALTPSAPPPIAYYARTATATAFTEYYRRIPPQRSPLPATSRSLVRSCLGRLLVSLWLCFLILSFSHSTTYLLHCFCRQARVSSLRFCPVPKRHFSRLLVVLGYLPFLPCIFVWRVFFGSRRRPVVFVSFFFQSVPACCFLALLTQRPSRLSSHLARASSFRASEPIGRDSSASQFAYDAHR